jgi:hypothetical protein
MKRILVVSLSILALLLLADTPSTMAQAVGEKKDAQSANSNSAKPKPAMSKKELERKLTASEKSLWEAFKNKKPEVFKRTLTADGFQIDAMGITANADIAAAIGACEIKDYALSDFKLTTISSSAALLTYKATTHGSCGGQPVPETVYTSTVWVNRGGKWQALFHQESQAPK